MKFSIASCSKEDAQVIDNGLGEFNINTLPAVLDFTWKNLQYGIYNKDKELVGGVLGGVGGWGGLEINIMWVREDHRGQSLGTQLLKHMEAEGKKLGAWKAQLGSFSFQAKDFYLKNGYEICGEIEGFPKGHSRYFFHKDI